MPEKVAQFHEQSGNTFVSAAVPMKANALANPVLVDDEAANIALAEPVSAEDSVAEMTSDEESMARVPGPDVDSEEWDTHLDVLKYEQKGVIAELAAEQPIPVAPSVSSSKSPLNSILKGQQVKPEMQVASFEDQNRTTAVGTHSAASKSSRSTLQTDNTQEGSISNGVQLLSQLEHFLSQTGNLKKKQTKEPLKFKDAVGRKFSFPYDICATWPVRSNSPTA